jgi:hypothetical protein
VNWYKYPKALQPKNVGKGVKDAPYSGCPDCSLKGASNRNPK